VRDIATVGMYHQPEGCNPAFEVLPPGQERIELVLKGRGWLRTREGEVEIRPGHLLWHVAGEETISRSDWKNPYACLCVKLRVSPGAARRGGRMAIWRDLDAARDFARQAIGFNADEEVDREGLAQFILGSVLVHGAQGSRMSAVNFPRPLGMALELIGERCRERLGVPEIARAAGVSPSYLHALFRLHLNASPHEILLRQRLKLAREKLAGSDAPIKEIAYTCGFATAAAFSCAFKARAGMSPLAYRRYQLGLQA